MQGHTGDGRMGCSVQIGCVCNFEPLLLPVGCSLNCGHEVSFSVSALRSGKSSFHPSSATRIPLHEIQLNGAKVRCKAVGGERSRNVLDALVERLERNSGTVDNQRRALRVIPGCPTERMNVDHVPLTARDTCAPLAS